MTARAQPVRIRDEEHFLTRDAVVSAARREVPRRLNAYYVEVEGRRFPPKQLLRSATQTTKPFDTAVAVRALRALGFDVVAFDPVKESRPPSGNE
jgi:hypothetical protein